MSLKEMERTSRYNLNYKDYELVISYFLNNNDNTTTAICKEFGFNERYVNYIIDVYLSKKKNYMGAGVEISKKDKINNAKPIRAYNKNGLIGIYESKKECGLILGVSWGSIEKHINGRGGDYITHINGMVNRYEYIEK